MAAAIAAITGALPRAARAVDYNWNAGFGNFQTPANWSGGPVGTFPNDSTDNAIFNLGTLGYFVNFSGSVTNNAARVLDDYEVIFDLNLNTYTLTSGGSGSSSSLFVGSATTLGGFLALSDGTVSGVQANVGASKGALTVGSGGTLNLSSLATVGGGGTGTMSLINGGDFNHSGITLGSSGGTGTLDVIGSGATVSDASAAITLGSAGTGNMLIEGGAVVTSSSGTFATTASSVGTVLVTGAGSTWTYTSFLVVGSAGIGSLTVEKGGDVTHAGVSNITVGGSSGASGSVNVTGPGSTLTSSALLTVGNSGDGTLVLENGGAITSGGANLAAGAGSTGVATLSGTGTTWTAQSHVSVGGQGALAGGIGTLTINSGTTFNNTLGQFRIHPLGSVNLNGGTLNVVDFVSNAGAFNFNGGTFNIVGAGSTLTIGAGGQLGSTLVLGPAQTVNVTNNTVVSAAGLLVLDGGSLSSAALSNSGEIHLANPISTLGGSSVLNSGRITGNGRVNGSLSNNTAGEVRAASAADRLLFTAASNTNGGTINALNGGTVEFTNALTNAAQINLTGGILKTGGTLTNNAAGRISGRGTLMTGAITNSGQLTLSAGLSDVFGAINNNATTAKLIVTGGGTSTFYHSIASVAGAEIRVSTNSTAVFLGDVTGPATYTGSGTKIFEAGFSALAALETPGSTVVEAPAQLTANHIREASLTVNGLVTINPDGTAAHTSKFGALSIDGGGTLALNDNDLIVDYTGASVESQVRGWVLDGLNSGTGITTLATPEGDTVLAVAEQFEWARTSFNGFTLDGTTLVGKYTYFGDANLDGQVTTDDYVAVDLGLGTGDSWVQGDFDMNGAVTTDDYVVVDLNLGKGTSDPLAYPEKQAAMIALHTEMFGQSYVEKLAYASEFGWVAASVPEPGAVAALGVACALVARRRRPAV